MQYPSLHQPGGFRALAGKAAYNDVYGFYGIGFETENIPGTFGVYIPPGTIQLSIYLFKAQENKIAASMRFGDVPQNISLASSNYLTYSYDDGETGGILDGKTYVPKPHDGYQIIIDRRFMDRKTGQSTILKGGWLNVKVYSVKGMPFKLSYSCQVHKDVLPTWLATVPWDANGDPAGATPAPTPTPEPIPDPDPDPSPVPVGKISVKVNGTVIITNLPLTIEVK